MTNSNHIDPKTYCKMITRRYKYHRLISFLFFCEKAAYQKNSLITTIVLCLLTLNLQAQENQEVSPKEGVNGLAIKYYGIEFTEAQRLLLKDKEIEFIFLIDKKGKATLSEVNGIDNKTIIDSLINKTEEIENFNPRIKNSIPEESIYFMKLTFPTYQMTSNKLGLLQGSAYKEANLEDFEYITLDNSHLDLIFGGMINQFIGKPYDYLKLGGGMKMNLSYTDSKNYLYGLNMNIYGNQLKKEYPLNNTRQQLSAPPTLLVGLIFGKSINKIDVQAELNIASQNITERLGTDDENWIQLKGWSPGILVNYPIRLGKQRPTYYYGQPSLFENNLNLSFGIRYLFLSIPEASGLMAELGVSYRMTIRKVKEYKLK